MTNTDYKCDQCGAERETREEDGTFVIAGCKECTQETVEENSEKNVVIS